MTPHPEYRCRVCRFGYLLIAIGLAVTKWPLVIQHDGPWPLFEGVATSMLVALSLLSFLGLRYPLQMLPILPFELAWKVIWVIVVALVDTAAAVGRVWIGSGHVRVFYSCLLGLIVLAVIPWRYAVAQCVQKQGDRWRPIPRVEQDV